MSSLEDRLFYRLEANLNHRDEVIENYGHKIDVMRNYSFKHDIAVQLAAALNMYRKSNSIGGDDITSADIGDYRLMHGSDNILSYELTHGIKTFTFHIALSGDNRDIIMQKVGFLKWFGGAAFLPICFSKFKFRPLYFGTFGLVITGGRNNYYPNFQHEALHTDIRNYSQNFNSLVSHPENLHYPAGLCRAKFQASLTDEILAFIYAGVEKGALQEKLRNRYWKYYVENLIGKCFNKPSSDESLTKQKAVREMLAPVKAQINGAVDASFYLKTQLNPDILTPLFFALGPNEEEIRQGILYGPFSDIKGWGVLLNNGSATPEKIKAQLQKKGYCRDSAIFSYLKR